MLELEALSGETSSDKRRQLLHRITDLFYLTGDRRGPRDTAAFGSLMERVAYELEVEARAELAERICDAGDAPRHLVCRLANDEIAVARPVLERSPVLTDEDLMQIAAASEQSHLHAISRRPSLRAPVTDVIVARGERGVLVEVAGNIGAEFSCDGFSALAAKAGGGDGLLTALDARADLPAGLRDEITRRVAHRIKTEMAASYDESDMAAVDALVERSASGIDFGELQKSNADIRRRAWTEKLAEDDIADLARSGRLSEAVHAVSVMSGLDDRIVSHCLLKADMPALGIICKSVGFKGTTYLALLRTRFGHDGFAARNIARAMREYDTLSRDNAKRTVRFLKVRRNVETAAEPMA